MWFITVVEKMDPDGWEDGLCDTGLCRTWGFYSDVNRAISALHNNETDMHEYFYDYAIIEEYDEGICNDMSHYQWFKWDDERDGYFEIDEPRCVSRMCCFAIG